MGILRDRVSFFCSLLVMWWSFPLTVAFGDEWSLSKSKRNDCFAWTAFMNKFYKVKLFRVGDGECYRDGPCVWICNHRDWGDFFIDLHVVEGRSCFLSRLAVLGAFPLFGFYGLITRNAVFFRRNALRDFAKFNQWVTQQIQRSPCHGIVVYPEGTRNVKPESLPLKRGMLRYAYAERTPVQVVITTNKEHVMSQRLKKASFGVKCVTSYSDLVVPTDYSSFQDFMDEVQQTWDAQWKAAYGANFSDAVEVTPSELKVFVPQYGATMGTYAQMIAYAYTTVALMLVTASFCFVLAQKVVGLRVLHFGTFGTDVVVLSFFLAFFVACTKLIARKQD